ncbi:response regulator transcription factor [Candidatus Nanogingivalis gingivitcus]|jgi:two component transcriptional regulator, winged helix family|uniref:Transcriptional regulatory protein TcrA n=1 Tax=Candidatus Nanogingivalis gingivitcus TaxID=2171992 RepID=A0ABY0FJ81_9BACT|nr:response regulator transcription factor [Candidatus Nanogingivalis gingivitcus]RYC72979.1 Transcriptional regulatory protein TcrA [Candidatus Nanogingivalis gingivitcus]
MRILVVDDEKKIALGIKKALESQKYAVDVCHDGIEALNMAEAIEYDLIILDRMLPGMDGVSIIKNLRSQNIYTPILLLTALGTVKDKTDGLDAGADDYLPKPFALDELLARVRAILRRPKVKAEIILTVGDLSLNLNTHSVKRSNKDIILTNKEFSLLEFLMRNKNQPISKEQIITHVWNWDSDILPNNIEVYISYLRDKVDKPFSKKLIKTVRGVGYKISDD